MAKKLNSLVGQKKKIAMVDCRPEAEQNVSIIRGSIVLPGVVFKLGLENNLAEVIAATDVSAAEVGRCMLTL